MSRLKMSSDTSSPTKESVNCPLCNRSVRFNSHLREHTLQCHHFCFDCDQQFANREDTIEHLIEVHQQLLKCEICDYMTLRRRELPQHIRKVHPNVNIPNIEDYITIKRRRKSRKNSTPEERHEVSGEKMNIEPPKKRASKEKIEMLYNIDCKYCSKKFRYTSHIKEHYNTIHFHCFDCDESLTDREGMLEHLAQVHKFNIQCEFCSYTSMRERDIQKHVKKCHDLTKDYEFQQEYAHITLDLLGPNLDFNQQDGDGKKLSKVNLSVKIF